MCGGQGVYTGYSAHRVQKRASDPLELELQAAVATWNGYWELNPSPLQAVLALNC